MFEKVGVGRGRGNVRGMPTRVGEGEENKEDRGDDDPRDEDDRDTILYFAVHFSSFPPFFRAIIISKEARSAPRAERRKKEEKNFESQTAVSAAERGSLNLIFRVEGREARSQ